MGIGKTRTFHTEAIEGLIRDTGRLMEAADKITKELYEEMRDIAAVLASLPADVRDQGLYEDVLRLRDSLRTDEFLAYRKEMSRKLERLLRDITQGDRREAAGLDAVAADVRSLTARIKDLSALIPEGADSGSYEDFRKKYEACVRAWDASEDALERLKQALKAALHGVHVKGVCMSSDPVNLSTGNFTYEKEDLRIPGNPPLIIRRSYNALSDEKGLLGQGWRFSWESCIRRMEAEAVLCAGDGHEERYERGRDGSFWGSGTRNRLTEGPEGYELTTPEGIRYRYDTEGRLTGWKEAFRGTVRLSYEGEKLCRIFREPDGAGYRLVYGTASDGEARLLEIREELPGDNGEKGLAERTVSYTYDERGHLEIVTGADGNTLTYGYDEEGRIRSVTNAEGTVTVVNTYDEEGRCIRQEFPDGGAMEYAYEEAEACVTLTERNGSRIRYYHDDRYHHTKTVYEDGEEQYAYNQRGQCIRHKDALGNITRYSYDVRGNLTQVIDALGVKSNATYDGDGHLLKLTVDGVTRLKNCYDSMGRLTSSSDAIGRKTEILYGENGRAACIRQADGSETRIAYDDRGNISEITGPDGSRTRYDYDAANRLIAEENPQCARICYAYDSGNRVTEVTDALGRKRTVCYNASGKPVEEIRTDGKHIYIGYNVLNRPAWKTDAEGNTERYAYDAMWNLAGVCHPGGGRTEYVYDQRNRLIRETDPEGHATEYGYDAAGNRILVRGADGSAVHAAYDAKRRITAVTDRDGNTTQYTYDGQGNLILIRDAAGGERRMEYDGAGQKISETDALGNTTRYEYNALGQPSCIIDAKGRVTRHMYAPGGRLIKTTYPDGTEETYDYDPSGRVAEKKTRNGQTVTYRYDLIGRLTETDSSGGGTETYEYDGMDRIARITDALGNETHYTYDGNGNLTRVTDALGNETCYTYDGMGGLLTVTRYEGKAGSGGKEERTVYQRDLCGRVTAMTDPLGQTETYAYDPYGRMIRKCDRDGNETRYAYTPEGKLAELLYGDGRKASYHYDPLGALTQVTDWLGTTRMENDALGRVLKVTDPYGKEVAYEWGSTGERKKLTYPDGQEARYRYNEAGQLSELAFGAGSIRYGYDGAGRLCRKQFPNGVITEYTYDNTGHLEKISHTGKDFEESYSYRYDPAGNKIEAFKQRPGMDMDSGSFRYGYDALHRLTQVSRDGRLLRSYGYDAFGNRTRKEEYIGSAPVRTSYFYNVNNQLTAQSNGEEERTYTYDGRGNLTAVSRGEELLQTFTYDTANRMSSAVQSENGVEKHIEYKYNAFGKRIELEIFSGGSDNGIPRNMHPGRISPNRKIHYTTDLTREYHNLLLSESEEKQEKQIFYWDGNVSSMEEEGRYSFYLQDDLGSPMQFMDEQGGIRETYGFDEFGRSLVHDPEQQPFVYTGYQMEEAAGLYYAQARRYDAFAGRFVSEDKLSGNIVRTFTLNKYSYCWNNPLIFLDLTGLDIMDALEGLEAHRLLQSRLKAIPGVECEVSIPNSSINGNDGRADIVYRHGNVVEIYEIKKISYARYGSELNISGREQLRRYLANYPAEGVLPGTSLNAVIQSAPIPSKLHPDKQIRYYIYPSQPGMVYWGYVNEPRDDRLASRQAKEKEEERESDNRMGSVVGEAVEDLGQVAMVAGILFALYEVVKWGAAILLAPETFGASLGGAACLP
ncbi:MAG: hypothetical protein K2N01_03210 [Lachnospiraceae bacterium]|nr:hypothetical protein [Lachnospiraceae bacterium]